MNNKDVPVDNFVKSEAYKERLQRLCKACIETAFIGDKLYQEDDSVNDTFEDLEGKLGALTYIMELMLANGDLSAANMMMAQVETSVNALTELKEQSLVNLANISEGMKEFFNVTYKESIH